MNEDIQASNQCAAEPQLMRKIIENVAAISFGIVVAFAAGISAFMIAPNDTAGNVITRMIMLPGALVAWILTPGGVHGDFKVYAGVAVASTAIIFASGFKFLAILWRKSLAERRHGSNTNSRR